jgi:NADH dehydrogenase [ubiquinone] 1 alpha subcomplex assembly factor 6
MSRVFKYVTDRHQMSAIDSQKYIARQVRDHDYDRYFATLFCPTEQRPALLAIYAFNIEIATIRETVSETLIGQMRLQWWRDTIDAVFDERPSNHPVAAALGDAISSCEIPRQPFDHMIDGRELDLTGIPRDDPVALESYVDATSSSVVQLALAVLGACGENAEHLAHHAGLAWGLTGLLRSMPFQSSQRNDGQQLDLPENTAASVLGHLETAREIQTGVQRQALGAILPVACVPPYLERLARAAGDPFAPGLGLSRFSRQWRMTMAAFRGRI